MPLSFIPSPSLRWSSPSSPRSPYPLPSSITRSAIPSTPPHNLELLTAQAPPSSSHPPVFFLHGGFGGAFVWVEWMTFLQQHGYTCYAVSLRGHGESWNPGFWRMTWLTGLADLAKDVRCAWEEVLRRENSRLPVLVGHSSGGGLAQYVLSEGLIRAEALVLCGAVPGFGAVGVYWNWAKLDPWFLLRDYLHLMHPRSPLSSTDLVQNAFFSPQLPRAKVEQWQRWMPDWESMLWPLGMMRPFVSFSRILGNIPGMGKAGAHVCIIAGGEDKLVDVKISERLTALFSDAVRAMEETKKVDISDDAAPDKDLRAFDKSCSNTSHGVRFVVLEKAPHHFQNDVRWDAGAEQLLVFLNELH